MKTIIPEIGQWVYVEGAYDGPGRIEHTNIGQEKFIAIFLTSSTVEDDGGGSLETYPFSRITDIETDQEKIMLFELELEGKVCAL